METPEPKPVRRAISDTIVEFGQPVLRELVQPSVDALKESLDLVIMIWNAHAMALPEWSHPEHLEQLATLARDEHAPGLRKALGELSQRRSEQFADDARVVSKWDVLADEQGRVRFDCTAKLP
jgi:hypothetical protein